MLKVLTIIVSIGLLRGNILITSNISLLNSLMPSELFVKPHATLFRVGRSGFGKRVKVGSNDLIYFDQMNAVKPVSNVTNLFRRKIKLLSILVCVDLKVGLSENFKQILMQSNRSVDVFFSHSDMASNQTLEIHQKAFTDYRFSLILEQGSAYLSSAVVNAIMLHTVPIYNGFFEVSNMFANGVAAWNELRINFPTIVHRAKELNNKIKFLWSYQQILQEILYYRYGSPPEARARYMTENLYTALRKPLAFLGVYSKLENKPLRDAIRSTWKKVVEKSGFELMFFLSSGNLTSSAKSDIESENEAFNDIAFLPVAEGYMHNSRKGVAFARWIRDNRWNFQYIIKTDDDVYLRPEPLLAQLHFRIPLGYVWGFMDYISPVPKNSSDPFYSPPHMYPFSTFPTYPRGAVRVLSTDLMEAIAKKADRKELRMIYGDDPTMGVHLRQLIMERDVPFINIDDFDSYENFAMHPSCTSKWSRVKNETWVIHHVNATQILCLWQREQSGTFPACDCL